LDNNLQKFSWDESLPSQHVPPGSCNAKFTLETLFESLVLLQNGFHELLERVNWSFDKKVGFKGKFGSNINT